MYLFTRREVLRRLIIPALFLPTFIFSLSFMIAEEDEGLAIGDKMPLQEQKLAAADGNSYVIKDLINKNGLIIVFSCNTCPFVVGGEKFAGWEKQYNDLNNAAKSKDIGFVLINSNAAKRDGDDSMEKMTEHAKDKNYSMPYLMDNGSEMADSFGAKTTPHVYAFNNEAELVYKGSIDNSWDSKRKKDEAYLYKVIDHLGDGAKLKKETTPPRGCSIKRVK